jgi:succinyl-diaminopimelate desuccinylase
MLIGRGASDMKSAIAAFAAAAAAFIAAQGNDFGGSISLLITGDEEGPAINGTVKVLDWLASQGERLDACVVGEPTNPEHLGDMIKIGRRGSLTGRLKVVGLQGHIAYPHLADNPVPRLLATLTALNDRVLDTGNAHFQASNLEVTTIDCGNPATNVIPAAVNATFNIRFNTEQSAAALTAWIEEVCGREAGQHELRIDHGSDPFLTEPGAFTDLVAAAVQSVTGRPVELSTTGGTSDARFIKDYCPVVEFGLVGQTMHKVDERCRVDDIDALARIYQSVLERYFQR